MLSNLWFRPRQLHKTYTTAVSTGTLLYHMPPGIYSVTTIGGGGGGGGVDTFYSGSYPGGAGNQSYPITTKITLTSWPDVVIGAGGLPGSNSIGSTIPPTAGSVGSSTFLPTPGGGQLVPVVAGGSGGPVGVPYGTVYSPYPNLVAAPIGPNGQGGIGAFVNAVGSTVNNATAGNAGKAIFELIG